MRPLLQFSKVFERGSVAFSDAMAQSNRDKGEVAVSRFHRMTDFITIGHHWSQLITVILTRSWDCNECPCLGTSPLDSSPTLLQTQRPKEAPLDQPWSIPLQGRSICGQPDFSVSRLAPSSATTSWPSKGKDPRRLSSRSRPMPRRPLSFYIEIAGILSWDLYMFIPKPSPNHMVTWYLRLPKVLTHPDLLGTHGLDIRRTPTGRCHLKGSC
jgi:hypothetical protein